MSRDGFFARTRFVEICLGGSAESDIVRLSDDHDRK